LKRILKPFEGRLVVETDEPGNYYLNTRVVRNDGYVIFFGAVQIKKRYVSFHLMPVYAFPDLLDGLSGDLKKRMQGKACFNFTRVQDETLSELADLVQKSIDRFTPEAIAQWMQPKK
jgi:hypothetical protein